MRTIEFLTDPALRDVILPGVVAGLVLSTVCALLSPFVVLKKYAFVGQGVSHCAFGGVGVAAVLGLGAGAATLNGAAWYAVVATFCLAAAWGMALISDRKTVAADTAIGVFLVGSMALGAVLISIAMELGRAGGGGWESILFGQILTVSPADAWVTAAVGAGVLGAMWVWRRPLIFWAFDESASPAFGVAQVRMRLLMMTLLALAVVTAMKVVGVVLPTAMLVLPGATALSLPPAAGERGRSLRGTLAVSWAVALLGLAVGFVLSLDGGFVISREYGPPTGASIVLALTALFALVRLLRAWR